ncbi:hypothetical protein JHK87_022065 [Glycine soja]|nr:hypothetical protein JHK87_022065 [Glycine soja]KAG5026253.1 hypothetical protein JHK86_022167 [Glycine max]
MKVITFILIVLVVLSIGIENEGPLKVIEARICEDTLYQLQCNDFKCNTACRKKYGKLASVIDTMIKNMKAITLVFIVLLALSIGIVLTLSPMVFPFLSCINAQFHQSLGYNIMNNFLDYKKHRPSQELVAKELHGVD